MFDFDDFMRLVPSLVLFGGVTVLISWIVIRGAVLSALRKHAREQDERPTPRP